MLSVCANVAGNTPTADVPEKDLLHTVYSHSLSQARNESRRGATMHIVDSVEVPREQKQQTNRRQQNGWLEADRNVLQEQDGAT
jgi:hypothetical protein